MAHPHSTEEAAAAVVSAVEHGAVEAANTGTVGMYFVREHVHQSLPAVLQAHRGLQATSAAAAGAMYAANHSREFASTLRRELPASLHRIEAALRDATWAASDVTRQHKEQHGKGGSGSSLGGLLAMPPRLRGLLWQSGASPRGGSGSSSAAEPNGSDGMYG